MEATKDIDVDGILTKNPFRYRGYYYDEETGFYYLSSRYYELVRSAVYTGDTTAQTPESRMQYTYTKDGNIGTLSYQEQGSATRTYTSNTPPTTDPPRLPCPIKAPWPTATTA